MSGLRVLRHALLLSALCVVAPVLAQEQTQDQVTPPPPADVDQPRPALMDMALASKSTLVSVAHAGQGLVAVGHEGVIVTSSDGRHWTQIASPVSGMLDHVRFFDAKNGWILGYDGVMLQTTDGGQHWTLRRYKLGAHPLYDLLFLDAQHAIAIGGFGDYLTTEDGGQHWQPQDNPLSELGMHMNAIIRLGDGSLFIAGERGLMARSKDNGANWTLIDSPYTGSFFGAIAQGEHGVLVYGLRGNIYSSVNVADTGTMAYDKWDVFSRKDVTDPAKIAALGWKHLQDPVTQSLFGGTQLADGKILLAGVNGAVALVVPATATVQSLNTPADQTLGDVTIENQRIIAVGRMGAQDIGVAP